MTSPSGSPSLLGYIVPIGIVLVVIALRWRRMSRARPLKVERLWILPAFYLAIVGYIFFIMPPSHAAWAWAALALAVGAGFGWYRGSTMKIEVDPETHALTQKASPAAMLLLVGLIALRLVFRAELTTGGGPAAAALAAEVAMAFALGMIATTRLEMALRARRSLADARAVRMSAEAAD